MVENPKDSANLSNLTQDFTTLFVKKVLEKHGFNKENVKPISDEQRAQLKGMVEDLKAQVAKLSQPKPTLLVPSDEESSPKSKKQRKN